MAAITSAIILILAAAAGLNAQTRAFIYTLNNSGISAGNFLYSLLFSQSQAFFALGLSADPDNEFLQQQLFAPDTARGGDLKFLKVPKIEYNEAGSLGSSNLPPGLDADYELDSTAKNIRSRSILDSNIELGYSYPVNIDDYLRRRKNEVQKQVWDSLITDYDIKKALSGRDLAMMISQSTGLTIPVPPNPLSGIFGKPEISINVNGEVNLRIGYRWDSQNLGTVSAFGQTQSSPIFNQDIRVNVTAKIGDKLKLGTDWNTRNTFDYQNKFKIGYDGEDDEIIKKVEFGNVDFPIPSTLIGGGSSLFGVRADFQFGPLFLKSVFSQRKGQRKFLEVKPGGRKVPFSLRAYEYSKNHFFLDTAYKAVYDEYFKNGVGIIPKSASHLRIKDFQVWEAITEITDPHVANAVAIADLPGKRLKMGENWSDSEKNRPIQSGIVERGRFALLDSTKFKIDYNLGTLNIYNLRQDRYYAVSYRIEGENSTTENDDIYYGSYNAGGTSEKPDTLLLKLIYRPNLLPGYKILWDRQMKNIYSINASNVNTTDTKIGIWYIRQNNDSTDIIEGANDKLVTILGVDQTNNSSGVSTPDGVFDLRPPFFDPIRGEIIFPSTEPFADGLRKYFSKVGNPELAEQYTFDQVYDTTFDVAKRNTARDRFVISGEVSGRQSNIIALGAFNLPPNSVRVLLNGVQLREYEDYVVNYYSGTITLRNPRALLPQANLQIEYEQQDMLSISTRTLAGLRGDLQLYKSRNFETIFGFTLMHYDQSVVIDKVRLGDEPVSNTMFGFDGRMNWNTPWLTKALDMLPFYDTKAPSSIALKGEWAMMLPDPNKKKSEIASDNGASVAIIDDFEGAQRYIPLGSVPSQWQYSSPPNNNNIDTTAQGRALYRGRLFWFQYFIPRVPLREVYPENKSYQQGRSNINPLQINFTPDFRGIYNQNAAYLDIRNPQFDPNNTFYDQPQNREKIWGGMMRLLSSFNTNFDNENIEYIEVMMRIDQWEPDKTKMYIDLGQISEDMIPNNAPNSEDGITVKNPLPNGIIDNGEDVGIDGINDTKEQDEYPSPLNLEADPARDNYKFDFNKEDKNREDEDFEFYNNFEGNATVSEIGQFPDKEMLNPNNGQAIALDDSYFTYEVDLYPDPNLNSQIVGGSNNWFLYRIPIRKPSSFVGNPQFSNIQYVRVRFQGGRIKARIADWRLVGSQWQRISNFQENINPNDSVLQLAFVNLWENSSEPDNYSMPPGVSAPRLLNSSDATQDIRMNEQSLVVKVKNLRWGDERMAVRIFRQMDIFYYKELKFFIHGDGSMPVNILPGVKPKAYAFLRFGTDSANYYEYRRPLLYGWQDLSIKMADLTAIKQIRDTSRQYGRQVFAVPDDPLASFAVKGNPILTRVQFFGIGVANPSDAFQELSTTLWLDEMRVINAESSADWAGVANFDMTLADLGTFNASFNNYQPNFHKIEERFGTRVASTNWNVSMTGNLEKFAPKSFTQMKVPITYTHSEFLENPDLVANSDIDLNQAAKAAYDRAIANGSSAQLAEKEANEVRLKSQTVRVQDSWALTGIKLGLPVKYWLVDETLNRLTVSYSYSQEFERSSLYSQRFNWLWKLNAQYTLPIPEYLTVKPLSWIGDFPVFGVYQNWKLNFLPSSFSSSLDFQRRRQTEQSRYLDFPSPVIRDFSAVRSAQFNWKLSEGGLISPIFDYSFNTNSTLVPYELDEFGKQRTGNEIAQKMFFNKGLIDFGINNMHAQTVTMNIKPQIPNFFGLSKYLEMSGNFNTNYQWQNSMQQDPAINDIAKKAGWTNSIRFNTVFKLKMLGNSWFGVSDEPQRTGAFRRKDDTASLSAVSGGIASIVKTIFFDWEKLDINFTQQNSSLNPGVYGETGLSNFWGRGMTFRQSMNSFGPSFAYQLGLVEHPHGGFNVQSSDKFPYFGFATYPGLRPPNAVLQDNYSQTSNLDLRTSRPLWEGAILDLNWKTTLSFNRNQTVETDENGVPRFTNIIAMESFNRTFLTCPSMFGFNLLNNTIENVVAIYNSKKGAIINSEQDSVSKNMAMRNALSESFYEGLEAFSIAGGKAGKFLPAFNWGIRWEGLEKWNLWKDFIKKVTVDHVYTSNYQENVQITDNGRSVQNQIVQYGFAPLIGVTATFDDKKMDGTLTTTLRWSTTTAYQLNTASRSTISQTSSNEITAQASYTMRGFEFPLFGIMLKNDLEYSFLFTFKDNANATYDVFDETSFTGDNKNGRKLNGNKQIIIEPRARYSVSNRLTASLFFRYEGTFTEGAAQPGFHTSQIGLDIRMSIAGGR